MTASKLAPSLLVLALAACNGGAENTTEATNATGGEATGTTAGTSTDPTTTTTGGGIGMVVLNEISSGGPLMGRDVIELYNLGDAQVDLSGWRISDDPLLPADKTYVFPDNVVIAPGGWLVVTEKDDVMGGGDFPFGISQDQEETLVLVEPGGATIDTVTFEGAAAIVSYCRLPDGTGAWVECDQTFEAANAAASNVCGDGVFGPPDEQCDGTDVGDATCAALGFMGGTLACRDDCTFDPHGCDGGSEVVINELESVDDKIELYNAGADDINLGEWILTDQAGGPDYDPALDLDALVFVEPTVLGAGDFLLIGKGTLKDQHPFGLGGEGDTVTLIRPDLSIADQVKYGDGEADVSYCRIPDGPDGVWTPMCNSTPMAPNSN